MEIPEMMTAPIAVTTLGRADRRIFILSSRARFGSATGLRRGPAGHTSVEFDLEQPIRRIGRLVDQFGELRFDPTGERGRLGATPSAERSRHVFRHRALATPDRSGP